MSDLLRKSLTIGLGIVFAVIMLKFLFGLGIILLVILGIAFIISLFRG